MSATSSSTRSPRTRRSAPGSADTSPRRTRRTRRFAIELLRALRVLRGERTWHQHETWAKAEVVVEFQDVVRRRRMVRDFEMRPVPPETVERILANALRGPSAGFSQGFEFLVLEGPEQTARFWDAISPERGWERAGWPGVYNAPLVVVPFSHKQTYIDRYA